ncbi:LysR family transcriptional regulator [Oscillibacter sp. MSJ-2]|uniref:LysR family transcriptional regulator n=1 Tax=Dysosmobacter acutus TaxID=2841504 RepID=A0ABS6FAZ7_9FIRM|nr:LysR family transcriptional regulator [Dysosmobacter acutus]MBU5626484.1 LysR family transcriptional regulator [Dysosmobacter acutus]
MTISQLRYVTEIIKCKSFNKASENLYISQPSLSVSIRKLEEELGEPLFVRTSTGVAPTPFGVELLPFIQDIVNLYEQMPLQVYGKASKHYLRISIANGGYRFFTEVIGKLYMAHKEDGIHIEYHDVPPEGSLSMVADGTAQIGGFTIWSFQKTSIESRLNRMGVRFVQLGSCSPTVSIGPKNPLWTRAENWVTLDMIREYPIIYSFSEHSNMLLKKLGLYNRGNLITCKERAGRGELLSHTDGISIGGFPSQVYRKASHYPNQRIFQLHGYNFKNEFGYIYNQSYDLSRVALEFIGYLDELIAD